MANRQIYQLDDAVANATTLLPAQDAAGSNEAGKVSVQSLKISMRAYKTYKAAVTFQAGPIFSTTVLEDDFDLNYTYDNPSNGTITITASDSVFTTGITFCVSGAINDAGTPYFLTGSRTSDTVCTFKIILHDGTGASTPFFTDVLFEIRVRN